MEGVQRLRDLLHILKQKLVKDKRARVTVAHLWCIWVVLYLIGGGQALLVRG